MYIIPGLANIAILMYRDSILEILLSISVSLYQDALEKCFCTSVVKNISNVSRYFARLGYLVTFVAVFTINLKDKSSILSLRAKKEKFSCRIRIEAMKNFEATFVCHFSTNSYENCINIQRAVNTLCVAKI